MLIVDDHSVVRMGLRMFFDLQPDIEVVGEAADGSEGVAMARRLEPDVVLMDLLMPNMDGITAIGRIKAERPETEIVTMTSFIEEEKVTAALEAGASGYVLKDAEAEEVAAAVRAAYAGEVHLDPAVARLLAQRMRNASRPRTTLVEPLTDREKDVLRLLGQGMSNKEIGGDPVHHRADRPDLRLEHPGQARPRVAHPGRAVRGRAQARRRPEGLTAVYSTAMTRYSAPDRAASRPTTCPGRRPTSARPTGDAMEIRPAADPPRPTRRVVYVDRRAVDLRRHHATRVDARAGDRAPRR